jgi:hypothetical protein
MVALSLRPLNRFSLCPERSKRVVGVILYDIILDRTALGTALRPSFNVNVGHTILPWMISAPG